MTNIKISELSELQYPYMDDFLPIVDTREMETKKIKYKNLVSTETDPVFTSSAASGITENNITNWNNKSDFSGDYNDLSNKPSIPTIPTNISAFENDVGYLTEHQDISGKEDKANKVTSLDGNSTNAQYPSAKVVYDELNKRLKYKGHVNLKEDLPATSDVVENDVYTVGENNVLYRANKTKQKWEPLSAPVSIEEIDNHIDEKITAIPVNNLLHFKGHVDSVNDLPKSGQVSGEIIDRKTVINSKKYDAFQNPLEDIKTKIRNNKKEGYNYFIGTQYGALNTNFPEIIEGVTIFNQWNDTSYLNMIVRVNASTSKPCVWVSGYPQTTALLKHGLFDDGTPVQTGSGELLIMQPAWIVMADTYTSLLYVLGNIPEPIKYKYTDIEQMPFKTNYSDSPSSEMIRYTNIKSIVTDGFVYNPGYKLFGFNDDETPYWITTTPSDINENDVYTVGENNVLYRANETEQKWEPLSAPQPMEEIDAHIDAKIENIPVNNLLHYKGHVNSKDDLPTAGQVSGELIEPNYVMDTSDMDSKVDNPLSISSSYWVATYLRTNVYAYVGTEFDEIIDGVCFGKYSNKGFPFIHVNASSTKPAKVYNCAQVWYDDGTTEFVGDYNSIIINKPAWLTITYSPSGASEVYGKLNHDLKLKYWNKDTVKVNVYDITNINNQSITINGFIYNLGYKMMHFDNNTERLSWITTTESDIVENDVYTVGANYDLVRGNAVEQKWELLAPKSDLYKTYTGYDETKTQVLKNINGTLTWVNETQN